MSTVRMLPLATPLAAGVVATGRGMSPVLLVVCLIVVLLLLRAAFNRWYGPRQP